ncbi:MAG: DUF1611 domain-containing protein [Myxococcales bacterium]|nr:DUF1611 domain-containing protein [Myxococcales bacterium]
MPDDPNVTPSSTSVEPGHIAAKAVPTIFRHRPTPCAREAALTAVVYCEGNFGGIDGKTANGLVRYSEIFEIVAVIDSERQGQDAGTVLGEDSNGIPVCSDLSAVLARLGSPPAYFIYGMAPASGLLSVHERAVVLSAIGLGMNVVNGLHEFLNDDPEFSAASAKSGSLLLDVRKPRDKKELRIFSGRIHEVTCPRIAVLGTDCAIGKRTTAMVLTRALCARGLKAIMIGTGQTGLIQGARYGVALDAIPAQFCAGELEALIVDAFEREAPDVIVIEGQGALGHPAYSTSSFILRGSCPDAVLLQHAPARRTRCDFDHMAMPSPKSEIDLIQSFADTKVIGITLNHENMSEDELSRAIAMYEAELGIAVTDALSRPTDLLVDMVSAAFPSLAARLIRGSH